MTISKSKRTRLWMFIAYPDSVPVDWKEQLSESLAYGMWCHSPLHNNDKNADGTDKKPHWHILISFDGPKSYEQVLDMTKCVNGTIPKPCASSSSMIRYFTHIDNPEKAQYSRDDIKAFGGMDVTTAYEERLDFQENQIKNIKTIIFETKIQNLIIFENYLEDNGYNDLLIFVHKNMYLTQKYLDAQFQLNQIKGK